jgi:hypothetical protein
VHRLRDLQVESVEQAPGDGEGQGDEDHAKNDDRDEASSYRRD